MPDYTAEHARAGIQAKLPALETWPNQFPSYVITTRFPEYSSVCPKTGLPDFGTITIQYMPKKDCIELKALKMYLLAYRSLGIFYENAEARSEEHTSELQSQFHLVCRLLLEKKKKKIKTKKFKKKKKNY